MTGPSTGPRSMGTPSRLMTRPIRWGPAAVAMIDWPIGMIMPPPIPCRIRKTIRLWMDHAAPDRAEPRRKSTSEAIHIRLAPKRSTAHPVRGMVMASASRYPVDTHCTVESGARKSRAKVGMATLTMVVSRIDMMLPSTTTRARRLRCGSSPARMPFDPVSPGAAADPAGVPSGTSGVVSAESRVVTVVLGVVGRAPPTVRHDARGTGVTRWTTCRTRELFRAVDRPGGYRRAMPAASANGITIEYETFGDPADPPVLLIMGFNGQLTLWDEAFCAALAAKGHYVIRYDNRDVGLSTWFDDAGEPGLLDLLSGTTAAPYSLADMAADGAGLLDALGLPSAHVVGVSMGGMIAQTFALEYPDRLRTLTSIMSTTGDPTVGQASPEALEALVPVPPASRNEAMDQGAVMWKTIGSPGFPFDEAAVRERAGAAYDRAFHPAGSTRQLAAIVTQPDRTGALGSVAAPTLVVHGEADLLVDPSGGKATAAAVPDARLDLVPGMGHDLPPELTDRFVAELADHFARG